HCAQAPEPPRLRNPGVHRVLEGACLRLLRKDPFERYQTAGELLRRLERAGQGAYRLPPAVAELPARPAPEAPLFTPRLVGREEELMRLSEWVEDADHGRSGAAVVRGLDGVGKSRLLAELLDHVRGLEVRSLSARFSAQDPRPYGGFRAVLEEAYEL